MNSIFKSCSALEELNISNFNTQNATNISSMFEECTSLKRLNLNHFNTQNVISMSYM